MARKWVRRGLRSRSTLVAGSLLFGLAATCGCLQEPGPGAPGAAMTAEAERDGGAGPVWHVTDADFSRQVLASPKLVLVDFWAPWCKPCLELNPIVEELAIAYQGRAVFAKLNIDENPQAAKEYQIQGVPTLLFFRSGQVAERIEGLGSKSELSVTLDSLLTR